VNSPASRPHYRGDRELFGAGLDGERVRDHIRHALGDDVDDASMRVTAFRPGGAAETSLMVVVREPAELPPGKAMRLRAVQYQRPVPHIKHTGSFGQIYHGEAAERDGFDEALLTAPDGTVAEGSVTNIGFLDGDTVVWPDAPALHGITMRLVEGSLAEAGVPSRRGPVRLADLPSFDAAFVTNSLGVAPVERVDEVAYPVGTELMKTVLKLFEATPWDPL
jgi:branched-subunit amino acid aminotransferase/4-amino-4-deoxychorismate lyase